MWVWSGRQVVWWEDMSVGARGGCLYDVLSKEEEEDEG